MPDTRAKLKRVIGVLRARGITQKALGGMAGWTPGYMSEVLRDEKPKSPSPEKMENLLRAIYRLRPDAGEAAEALAAVAERYGVRLAPPRLPAGPIAFGDINYVSRDGIESALTFSAGVPGAYGIDGPPMSGRSTALLVVRQRLLDQGYEVCLSSCRDELVEHGLIAASTTGIIGAIASRMLSSNEALDFDFFRVQEAIGDHLQRFPSGYGLLLDDIDALDVRSMQTLESMLRTWQTNRAAEIEGFVASTVWIATTSNVTEATGRSVYLPDQKHLRWFNSTEVKKLADAFARLPISAPASDPNPVNDRGWAGAVAASALGHFGGQPALTHRFIYERRVDGLRDWPADALDHPPKPYLAHLTRVAARLVDYVEPTGAQQVVAAIQKGDRLPPATRDIMVRLKIYNGADDESTLSCNFYTTHLLRLLQDRVGEPAP